MLSETATPVHSPFWLAFRVLDEPGRVFTQLAERPRALIPVLLMVISGLVVGFAMPASVLESAAERQLRAFEQRQEQSFAPDIRSEALTRSSSAPGRALVAAASVANSTISVAFTSVVLVLVFNATGARIRFREQWAISAHAFVPWIVGSLVTVMIIAALNNPFFKMSLGFLVGAERHPFLYSFADQFTFFGAWNMYLLALGNHIRLRDRPWSSVLVVVGGLWLVTNLLAAAIATAFASFTS